jgi:hypothetical protein
MKCEKLCSSSAWLFFPHKNFPSRGCRISKPLGQNVHIVFKWLLRDDFSVGGEEKNGDKQKIKLKDVPTITNAKESRPLTDDGACFDCWCAKVVVVA